MMQQRDTAPEKPVWLRRSAYRRHRTPAPRTAAPDHKMPCSMAAGTEKGISR